MNCGCFRNAQNKVNAGAGTSDNIHRFYYEMFHKLPVSSNLKLRHTHRSLAQFMPSWGATAALTMRGPISKPQIHLTMLGISPTPIQPLNKCYTTSNWKGLDPKVPHFWDRRCQRKWNYLWPGDCAEMNIPPDWTKTGNPGTQNIFLKQFNKKMVTFLEKLEKPKAYRVCHLS